MAGQASRLRRASAPTLGMRDVGTEPESARARKPGIVPLQRAARLHWRDGGGASSARLPEATGASHEDDCYS